jgi:hypothetical protein
MFVAVLANHSLEMGRKTLHGTGREVNEVIKESTIK